jgi:hypothetical protein
MVVLEEPKDQYQVSLEAKSFYEAFQLSFFYSRTNRVNSVATHSTITWLLRKNLTQNLQFQLLVFHTY